MAKDTKTSTFTQSLSSRLNLYGVQLALLAIRGYRYFLSPWLGNQCRFSPSCSHYAEQAYQHHGFIKGSWLTLARIVKCNPFHKGGFDPVPEAKTQTKHRCSHLSSH